MSHNSNRRQFLSTTAAASIGWVGAQRYAAGADAKPGPNEMINLGLIGCGARCRTMLPSFQAEPGARIIAACDVNSKHLAEVREMAGGHSVAAYHDYRQLLESKDIDAVILATQAHWHVLPTIAACQAGKDVYLEKPLGNSIGEGRFSTGSQACARRDAPSGCKRRVIIAMTKHDEVSFR